MTGLRRSLFSSLKQVLWALLLAYLNLAVVGWILGKQIGFEDALLVCLAIAVLVTIVFFSIYGCAALWTWLERRREEGADRREDGS